MGRKCGLIDIDTRPCRCGIHISRYRFESPDVSRNGINIHFLAIRRLNRCDVFCFPRCIGDFNFGTDQQTETVQTSVTCSFRPFAVRSGDGAVKPVRHFSGVLIDSPHEIAVQYSFFPVLDISFWLIAEHLDLRSHLRFRNDAEEQREDSDVDSDGFLFHKYIHTITIVISELKIQIDAESDIARR